MCPSFRGFPLFLFLTSVSSVSLPPSLSLLTLSSSTFSNSTDFASSFNGTLANPPYIPPYCSVSLGRDMSEPSCENAWQKIDRSTKPLFLRPRESKAGLLTPIRYLSDDGICAIDIRLRRGAMGDVSNGLVISTHAKTLVDVCVGEIHKGGSISDFSPRNELQIFIRSYEPYIDCDNKPDKPPPSEAACGKILSFLPASLKDRTFRTEEAPRERAETRLPRVFTTRNDPSSCEVVVDMPPSRFVTIANWFDIWAAGVAVNTMCIQHGFSGRAVYLGENELITISLGAQPDPPDLTVEKNVTTSYVFVARNKVRDELSV